MMSWLDESGPRGEQSGQGPDCESFEGFRCAENESGQGPARSDENAQDAAINDVLRALGIAAREVPEDVRTLRDRLDFLLSSSGVLYREIRLPGLWYADAMGLMIGTLRKTGAVVALLPRALGGYAYTDPETGRRVRVTARTAADISEDALCFYRPLPTRELKRGDFLRYIATCLTWQDLASFASAAMAVALVGLLVPVLNRVLMGAVIENGSLRLLFAAVSFLLFATLGRVLLSTVKALVLERLRGRLSVSVTAATMMRVLSLPAAFFREHSVSELNQCVNGMNSLCSTLVDAVFSTAVTGVFSLVYVAQVVAIAPSLALPGFAAVLLTFIASLLSAQTQMRIDREKMACEARERGLVYALINGIRRVRLSGAEERAFSQWTKLYAKCAHLAFEPPAVIRLFPVITAAVSLLGTAAMYYVAVRRQVGVADYYAFNAAYGYVVSVFGELAIAVRFAASMRPVFDRIDPLLSTVPETSASMETVTGLSGEIRMNHVAFGYEANDRLLFEDLDLTITAGQYVAIVGRSGCGKSTIVRLLMGFEKPLRGTVCYDGKDLGQLDVRSLRRQIGVVQQDSRLFPGSIFDNIAIAAPGLKKEDAWAAAEAAAIAEDIRKMPMGMDTILSDGGGSLSGGQRQRLMIARAIAPKPRILILDEATSALDNLTQSRIAEALDRMDCTRIVIAHRLSTIRRCDRILVIDGGRIAEDGTYNELMARGGLFTRLAKSQRVEDET